uniref:Ribosomal protein L28 n=1 Tax=Catagonus wagneri TaxID=51154 RepID=A0A8C3VRD0_9CETA
MANDATSTHLQWMITGNRASFLIKRNKQMKSGKSSNLKAHNSFCYNELIRSKAVGTELTVNGEGVLGPSPVCGPPPTRMPRGPSAASCT